MSTVFGTLGVPSIVRRPQSPYSARGVYSVSAKFGVYTGSSDHAGISGVAAAVTASMRDGKTRTLKSVVCVGAGSDAAQDIYAGACTVSADLCTFELQNSAGTELTSSVATTVPVVFYVTADEA